MPDHDHAHESECAARPSHAVPAASRARRLLLAGLVAGALLPAALGQGPTPGAPGGAGGTLRPGPGVDGATPNDRILGDINLPILDPHRGAYEKKRQGEMAYHDGRYAIASEFFRSYLDRAWNESTLIDGTTLLVKALLAQDKTGEARATIDAVDDRLPTLSEPGPLDNPGLEPYSQIVLSYWDARARLQEGDLDAATGLFDKVADSSISPLYKALGHIGLADCFMARLDYAAAERAFRTARNLTLGVDEEHAASLGLLRALVAQKKVAEVDALFGEIWGHSEGRYHFEIGMLQIASLLDRGETVQALDFYRANFASQTDYIQSLDHVETLRKLALALAESTRYDDALDVYQKLLPLVRQEEYVQAILLGIAETQDASGRTQDAIRSYQKFITLYPGDERLARIRIALARSYETNKQPEPAINLYNQVFANRTAPPVFRFTAADRLANLSAAAGQNAEATQLWQRAAEFDVSPEQKTAALYQAGRIQLDKLQDFNGAAQLFDQVATNWPAATRAPDARYYQAVSRQREKRYDLAAQAYSAYVKTWPEHPLIQTARLQLGICQRLGGAYTEAIATLKDYSNLYPKSDDTPVALLEASQAAHAAYLPKDALDALDRVIANFKESPYYPRALYERAFLRLGYVMNTEALEDCYAFLAGYSETHPDMAADVYLWLGDYYASLAYQDIDPGTNFSQAENVFLEVVKRYPKHPEAPNALYEAAKNAYYRKDADSAIIYLDRLVTEYPNAPTRIVASSKFLRGDIATLRSPNSAGFLAAAQLFEDAAQLFPRSELYYAAKGRRAECFYTIARAAETPDAAAPYYRKALEDLTLIIDAESALPSLVEKARYRAGKVYEQLNQPTNAQDQYLRIFYDYRSRMRNNNGTYDWFYFARAGFDLARSYETSSRFNSAISIYDDLANSGIPVAADARAKANALRDMLAGNGGPPSAPVTPAPAPATTPGSDSPATLPATPSTAPAADASTGNVPAPALVPAIPLLPVVNDGK